MNILVTGAKGFLGRNLVQNLKWFRDGKNRTRPELRIEEIYEYDRGDEDKLDEFCKNATFIFHCAGVNRPKETSEFMEGNFGFTDTLLTTLKKYNNRSPIVITSSIQATLSGRFGNSEYGRSKLAGEELMFKYGEETGAPVYVYRFPNLCGKWIRPGYNSAVATFCNAVANSLPYTVNDRSTELEMLFIDDLLNEFYDCMEGHPHHADFPKAGEAVDGIEYDGVTARLCDDGKYCYAPITHKATLGEIVDLLEKFKTVPQTLMTPDFTPGCFEKKLYSMYLSYLPAEKTIFDLNMKVDERGSFTELWHTPTSGQVSVNITAPGHIVKGLHAHNLKFEWFIVVSGRGLIREKNLLNGEIREYEVSGEKIQSVVMLPGYSHSIENLSETEPLITIMTCNENFDPSHPDTFFEPF